MVEKRLAEPSEVVEVPESRFKYAWTMAKPWLFGKEFVYAVAFTAISAGVHFYSHRPHEFGASFDYLWFFLISAGTLLVLRFLWALAIHPWKMHVQSLEKHMEDHGLNLALETRLVAIERATAAVETRLTQLEAKSNQPVIHMKADNVTINQDSNGVGAGSNAQIAVEGTDDPEHNSMTEEIGDSP